MAICWNAGLSTFHELSASTHKHSSVITDCVYVFTCIINHCITSKGQLVQPPIGAIITQTGRLTGELRMYVKTHLHQVKALYDAKIPTIMYVCMYVQCMYIRIKSSTFCQEKCNRDMLFMSIYVYDVEKPI